MSSPEFLLFKRILQTNGYFVTQPRQRLFGLLQHNSPLPVRKLIELVDQHDQATVYRNVALFEKLGIISRLQLGRDAQLELSDKFQHHHHHLTCMRCGKVIAIKENKIIESEILRIGQQTGFTATDHVLEIRGHCATCM